MVCSWWYYLFDFSRPKVIYWLCSEHFPITEESFWDVFVQFSVSFKSKLTKLQNTQKPLGGVSPNWFDKCSEIYLFAKFSFSISTLVLQMMLLFVNFIQFIFSVPNISERLLDICMPLLFHPLRRSTAFGWCLETV